MPRKPPLRAVHAGDEPPARQVRKTVSAAADTGDRMELLVSLRARISKTVDDPNTPARDLAALSRRLLDIAREIEAMRAADDDSDDVGRAAATPDEEWSAI